MKLAAFVSAVLASAAPFAFADVKEEPGADLPAEDYHYGMNLDVHQVLYRTDNSGKVGVVSTVMVFADSQGELHKVRFLEWGGRASDQG
jgi:hypothetical protein